MQKIVENRKIYRRWIGRRIHVPVDLVLVQGYPGDLSIVAKQSLRFLFSQSERLKVILTSPKPPENLCQSITTIKGRTLVHINPSWPGCWPILSIFLISSNVTPSLLNRPPCTTKYRFVPLGPIIKVASRGDGTGGFVAEIRVANGTRGHVSQCQNAKPFFICAI